MRAVGCLDIDPSAARATAASVAAEAGRAVVLVGDASDPVVMPSLVDEATQALGGLDGLVLNVGTGRGVGLSGTTANDWETTFASQHPLIENRPPVTSGTRAANPGRRPPSPDVSAEAGARS